MSRCVAIPIRSSRSEDKPTASGFEDGSSCAAAAAAITSSEVTMFLALIPQ
jgi:hypothetical protein